MVNFFGCSECVSHFEQSASKIEQDVSLDIFIDSSSLSFFHQKARKPEDVVMWLWSVHNNANERTKGTLSEDPAFPKQQFPPAKLCDKCKGKGLVFRLA